MNKRSESEILAGVLSYLALRGDTMAWRNNTGAYQPLTGGFVKYGAVGSADILCCQAIRVGLEGIWESVVGRMVGIEVKTQGKSPTPDQVAWGAQLTAHGGLYIVVHGVDEVRAALGEPQVQVPRPPSGRVYPK